MSDSLNINNYFLDDELNENNIFNDSFEASLISESNENKKNCEILKINSIFPFFLQEERSTTFHTNIKDLHLYTLTQSKINEAKKDCPPFCSIETILQIIDEAISDTEIKNKLIEGKEKVENSNNYASLEELTKKKRKREGDNTKDLRIIAKNEKKRGRKTHKHNINYIHDKYKADNIIKKIKNKLFKSVLTFVNNILNFNDDKKLLKLDYEQYINKLKREDDLNLLKMPLKDIVSLDISSKYNKESDFNKKIIDNIIQKVKQLETNKGEKINNYNFKKYKTIMFILDITFEDYIDISIFKKNLDDLIYDYGMSISNIDLMSIQNNVNAIKEILGEIKRDSDSKYLSFFIFFLYNYKRWFYLKKERKYTSIVKELISKNII